MEDTWQPEPAVSKRFGSVRGQSGGAGQNSLPTYSQVGYRVASLELVKK